MSKRPQLIPHFATAQEQSTFLRWMRLLRDDVSELSGSIGILVALSKRSEDHGLISVLNRNPAFWNSILDALNTSSFVVMGRIHDTTGDAYLKNVMRFLKTRKALSGIARHFGGFAATHGTLIIKVRKLRHNVFAHIAVTRPESIAFDFEGLTMPLRLTQTPTISKFPPDGGIIRLTHTSPGRSVSKAGNGGGYGRSQSRRPPFPGIAA